MVLFCRLNLTNQINKLKQSSVNISKVLPTLINTLRLFMMFITFNMKQKPLTNFETSCQQEVIFLFCFISLKEKWILKKQKGNRWQK